MQFEEREILGRYKLVEELGTGGMGTVYRARDTTLQRDVAIKVLNDDSTNDPASLERFKREAKAVAGLSHPNVISLFDFTEAEGVHYAVMEFARGNTLDDHLANGPISRNDAVELATGMARGLAAAHRAGIVHRDIKPSNVFLTEDNDVKLLDFGLATSRQSLELSDETMSAVDLQTKVGTIMGTVGYMSPEQVRGAPSDKRSDIFSFGAVLYEMLTGQRAFKRNSTIETMSAILNDRVPEITLDALPSDDPLLSVTQKCLEKSADERYQDFSEVMDALNTSNPTPGADTRAPRPVKWLMVAAALALLVALAIVFGRSSDSTPSGEATPPTDSDAAKGGLTPKSAAVNEATARRTLLPQLVQLAARGRHSEAYQIAIQIQPFLKDDLLFQDAWQKITQEHSLTTDPPGATVFYGEYGADVTTFLELGATPITDVRLPTTPKSFLIKKEGYHDAILTTDSNHYFKQVKAHRVLNKIGSIPEGMIHVTEGTAFPFTGMTFAVTSRPVGAFLMDRYEVTNGEYQAFVDSGAYQDENLWTDTFLQNGRELTVVEALKLLVDSTGRPGPSTWKVGRFPRGEENHPVQGVSWYEARAYARYVGKELPTVYHCSRANPSIMGVNVMTRMISLSNINTGEYVEVGSNRGVSPFGIHDLCGNVSEWVSNAVGTQRMSLGGSAEQQAYFFNLANPVEPLDRSRHHGFRCVKFLSPPTEDLLADVALQYRDYSDATPVSDEVFAAYRNQFQYDATPLNPELIYRRDEPQLEYVKERVEIDATYGDERIILHIHLPINARPPFQTLIYFHHAGSINPSPSEGNANGADTFSFVTQSGRAFVEPVLKGQWERNGGLKSWSPNTSQRYAEFLVKWIQDYRRTIDYLTTRDDIDAGRIGHIGDSWGSFNFPIIGAVEPRIKLGLCYVGGLAMAPARPEVDQISYVHRVTQPTLWLVGEYDQIFPLERSSRPAFELLGTPNDKKKLVVYSSGHTLPPNEVIRESLDWLDQYFGPPGP
ncbi:MAG: hypothetical protein CMJ70_10220 [Planctomycetaceae bacterium]|nr:hypothetical protein [Planctomycetaceae bacterium]